MPVLSIDSVLMKHVHSGSFRETSREQHLSLWKFQGDMVGGVVNSVFILEVSGKTNLHSGSFREAAEVKMR